MRIPGLHLLIISTSLLYWCQIGANCWNFYAPGMIPHWRSTRSAFPSLGNGNSLPVPIQSTDRGGNGSARSKGGNNEKLTQGFNTQPQDILYACALNSMCQCVGLPNETSTLIEINCIEVPLYKFPEFSHSSVRYIEMSGTHLQSVEGETFEGLRLKTLKLVDNELQDISERSFNTMSHSLMTLDISGNKLQHLPLKALQRLHSLTRLVAQRNYITSLSGNWEALVESLRSLHLSNNHISELTDNNMQDVYSNANGSGGAHSSNSVAMQGRESHISKHSPGISSTSILSSGHFTKNHMEQKSFSQLQKLLWLDLSSNRIYHLSPKSLPLSLITVDLSSNLLSTLPHHLFEHMHGLRIISLRDNLIRNLHSVKDMRPHMHLEKLDLGQNLIDHIESDWFHSNYTDVHIRALNLEKNYIEQLPFAAFGVAGIVHLVLAFNKIEKIDVNAFEGLTETLEYLDLERNQLYAVPAAIKSLNNLKYLYLTSNHIHELNCLPEDATNLRVLSLSGNNFTMIPVMGLKNYSQLSYLNLGYNSITDIPDGIFAIENWGSNLQTILLRNNRITHLHLGSFTGLDQIQEISLSFNDINIHHPMVFENISKTLKILELSFAVFPSRSPDTIEPIEALQPLSQLIWLGLDNNNLKSLSNESFANMHDLSYINLAFNQLTQLPHGLFLPDVHGRLVEIDLSYNALQHLLSKSFSSLGDLQTLNLQSNKLETIDRNSFYNLEFLRYIDLSYNSIHNISHGAFTILPNLAALDLMYNNLCSLSLRMFHFVSNTTTPLKLNVSHNAISYVDDALSSYMFIYYLDISHNVMRRTESFTNLRTLRYLDMAHNSISNLANHAFGDLHFLEVLKLANNNISSLRRRSFQGLNSLQELDLSYNKLYQLQVEQFSNLHKLRILRLRNNRLRTLPREVFMNTLLEYLDIAHNQLSVWPVPAFSDVGFTLRNIQMPFNNLEYLDSTMFVNSQFIYEINLSANRITVLPDNTFTFLNNLTNLDLSENPLVTTNLRQVFLHTPHLRRLNIRSMGLYVLPELNLPMLTELDVSGNFLQGLTPLNEMHQLRYVNMSNNKIVNASCGIDHLPNSIRVLDFAYNPIRRITTYDLYNVRNIVELNLRDVKISNPQIFNKLRSLRKLELTSQPNLDEVVSRLPGLQELRVHCLDSNIGSNLLAKLANNTKLQMVELYGYNVQTISPYALSPLARNQRLHLKISHTRISDLPPSIFYTLRAIPHLNIDLSHNKINALAADSFYPNKSFWDAVGTRSIQGGLDISHNPLECECGLVWLGHWLRRWLRESAQIRVIQKDDMKRMVQRARSNMCYEPNTGRRMPILEIYPEDLLCQASALSSSAERIYLITYVVAIFPVLMSIL